MPLRDHFRSPVDDKHSWDELHGLWPAIVLQHLVKVLPEPYFAAPGVLLGKLFEIDVATFDNREFSNRGEQDAGTVAAYAPPKPTLALEPELPNQDVYEIRVYDGRRRLVAAIELVSPSNKDRPERRELFVAKVAALLRNRICVTVVGVVSALEANLYADLLELVKGVDPALDTERSPMYAATVRTRLDGPRKLMDSWYHPLAVGAALPVLPIWLSNDLAVRLDLESTDEETCRTLRIA